MDPVTDAGEVDRDPADVARHSDIVITIVGYPEDVEEVYFGVDGDATGFLDLAGLALPTGLLAPTAGAVTGNASTTTVTLDYLFAAQER